MAAYHMNCPMCTRWDDGALTCVADPTADPSKCTNSVIINEHLTYDGGKQ